MSNKEQQSKKARGVSPNYLQFLWSNIAKIRESQNQGDFAAALKEVATLIPYLPPEVKDMFQEKANQINSSLSKIALGQIPKIQKLPDPFLRRIAKKKVMETYAVLSLNDFISKLSQELSERGYMENQRNVPTGFSPTWSTE